MPVRYIDKIGPKRWWKLYSVPQSCHITGNQVTLTERPLASSSPSYSFTEVLMLKRVFGRAEIGMLLEKSRKVLARSLHALISSRSGATERHTVKHAENRWSSILQSKANFSRIDRAIKQ